MVPIIVDINSSRFQAGLMSEGTFIFDKEILEKYELEDDEEVDL